MAQAAFESARQADGILPGHAAPLVLEGRALMALGKFDDALRALELGRSREPTALDDPMALLAWCRALARTGRTGEAADAYRALLPRASALSSTERAAAEVEAGLVAMSRGPAGLDESAAALREALREAQDETQAVAVLALALALDRRGDVDEARAILSGRPRDPRTVVTSARAREILAVAPLEGRVLVALALEGKDVASARDAWEHYAEAGGPWAGHARAHLAALSGKRGTARGP